MSVWSTYQANEWKCWPNRVRNLPSGIRSSSGASLGSSTSITVSAMIASDAQRFSTSNQFFATNTCGAKSAPYQASASS